MKKTALIIFLLAGLVSIRAAAQEPPARPVEVLPSQQVEVVRLEVVVAEKRGRPKAGLTREDFEVLEDGKPQPIVQFHAFARPVPGAPPVAEPPPAAAEPPPVGLATLGGGSNRDHGFLLD